MSRLNTIIEQLESKIPEQALLNPSVSKASVGWHIEHALLTINQIVETVKASDPKNYQWKFNSIRTFIYITNRIPRGKGKAPKSVQPKIIFTTETLRTHTAATKEKINILASLQRDHYFDHPYFGKLNLKPTIRFLEMHTKHHLNIIDDILTK